MIKKVLTYLTILAITALPVQLLSANVDNLTMQMSMNQQTQTEMKNECMHGMVKQPANLQVNLDGQQELADKSCCDDTSHDCQNCNNCPQAASAFFIPSYPIEKFSTLNAQKYLTRYLFLNGISQKNLLRPPRTLI